MIYIHVLSVFTKQQNIRRKQKRDAEKTKEYNVHYNDDDNDDDALNEHMLNASFVKKKSIQMSKD